MAELYGIVREFFTETLVLEHDLHTNTESTRIMATHTYSLPFISVVLYLLMVRTARLIYVALQHALL